MTDLNAPYGAMERDSQAWQLLEERLDMASVDASQLPLIGGVLHSPCALTSEQAMIAHHVLTAVHDALAHRRQS